MDHREGEAPSDRGVEVTPEIAAVACVAIVSASGLAGFVLWLRHREKRFVHEPLKKLEDRLERLETRSHQNELAKLNTRR